ncbi:MAG: decaprenyl-phosphate phosphoribosyltransferase [Elusimicrobiota bacterium]|jgi:4-hydroxybenzoate polyprenyltransferase
MNATVGRSFAYVRLLRPHQWLKNGFVLIGPAFGYPLYQAAPARIGLAFLSFCLASSAVYAFNDASDAEGDRLHPVKRLRPVAAGEIPLGMAWGTALALAAAGLAAAWQASPTAAACIAAYLAVNAAYSMKLKDVPILDVFIIAAGFILRLLTGTIGLGIPPSQWLLLCGLMFSLFLGFGKRRSELTAMGPQARGVLREYGEGLLVQLTSISAACAVISYSLYTMSLETIRLHGTNDLIYTVPFIVFGIFRYLYLVESRGLGQDTARDVLGDMPMLAAVIFWVGSTFLILR